MPEPTNIELFERILDTGVSADKIELRRRLNSLDIVDKHWQLKIGHLESVNTYLIAKVNGQGDLLIEQMAELTKLERSLCTVCRAKAERDA